MAQTEEGKKYIRVEEYKRKPQGGKRKSQSVREHCRSTPNKREQ
jgi:hypothetical protein